MLASPHSPNPLKPNDVTQTKGVIRDGTERDKESEEPRLRGVSKMRGEVGNKTGNFERGKARKVDRKNHPGRARGPMRARGDYLEERRPKTVVQLPLDYLLF